ncbi:unnamed protein product [Phytophthora fragariaefolia]|uniref:RNA-directed DNA polymerase n=1 Tax=Phytophthora fragariaefolia TaxID=1490495 RepID=A0A9W6TT02_9STRA|nr:unnamed protein product [Phytophthora fragariaefolia]
MTLGPAGAAMLQNRAKQTAGRTTINPRDTREAMVNSNRHPPEKLESFFQAAMERFLKEQQVPQTRPKPRSTGDPDVEMESVGSPDQPTTAWEREHIEHFIEALDDRDLADQLAFLRIPDADILEEVLRSRQRAKSRQSKKVYGSTKPRQKSPAAAAGTRAVRAVHVPEDSSNSDEESRSSSDEYLRRVYLVSRSPQDKPQDQRIRDQTQEPHHEDRHSSQVGREDVKLERSPGWNPVRAERSRFCIYAYVEKQSKAAVNKVIDNTCDLEKESATAIANLHQTDEYSRSEVKMILDISSGESREYWKYHVPDKKFKQAKAVGKINNAKATLLSDSGAEVSILDTAFARKVGWYVDNSQTLQCEGVGKSPYMAEGRTRLKITLAGSLVYLFDAWVGPPTGGQDLILGMDFMVPAGIRLDLADGTICLPDEIDMGGSEEVRLRTRPSDRQKLWVTRGDSWLPTYVAGPGRSCSLRLTNVSERKLILHGDTKIAMWLTGDRVPRLPGYVSVGSRRYAEWQNLAYQATTDENGVTPKQEEVQGPAVERPLYQTPTSILKRPPTCPMGTAAARQIKGRGPGIDSLHNGQGSLCNAQDLPLPSGEASCTQITTSRANGALNKVGICSAHVMQNQGHGTSDLDQRLNTSANQRRNQRQVEGGATNPDGVGEFPGEHKHIPADDATSTHSAFVDLGDRAVDPGDAEVCIKESGDLYAEDVEGHLAVLPEVTPTTEEVKIEDIQVGNPNDSTQEQVDQLKQIIWRRQHLLIGKGNALPPAAKGVICDIDVGNAKPVAQRVRKVAPQFREKLFQLITWLLSAKIIQHSTSPWASPIVVIIKKNGIDIRLCIDYRLVNSLTRLMVYPMPLINDLLDDLDKVLWYCSLDMASGFWVRSMTDRARAISPFITHSGLFEWNRMPFGLKNAPQIYQRLLDNALYGFLKITKRQDHQTRNAGDQGRQRPIDLFQDGEPDTDKESSVLGRRSYIDDILVMAGSWDMLCEHVDKLLDACDEWNMSISVAKCFWGLKKVDYLGHRISAGGMEARPKVYHHCRTQKPNEINYGIVDKEILALLRVQPNEINYGIVDKEILALLRVLDVCYTQLVTRSIKVLTRHSTLAWMVNSSGLQERLGRWAALLSNWTLEIVKCTKGENEILGVIAASITPREDVDSVLTSIAPRKQPRQVISMPPTTVESDEELLVVSFEGSARVKRGGGAFSVIVWSLPGWTVISGASEYKATLTVNEAEYHGLLLCFDLLAKHVDHNRLIICGDSNLFLHLKRDWNQRPDKLASAALQREAGEQVTSQTDIDDLATLNRVAELLVPQSQISVVKSAATTRSRQRRDWEVLQEPLVKRMRMERIDRAHDEEKWIVDLKQYLTGDVREVTSREAKSCAKIAED